MHLPTLLPEFIKNHKPRVLSKSEEHLPTSRASMLLASGSSQKVTLRKQLKQWYVWTLRQFWILVLIKKEPSRCGWAGCSEHIPYRLSMKKNNQILSTGCVSIDTARLHLQMQRRPAATLCCRQLAWESGSGMHVPGAVPTGRGAFGVALLSKKPLYRNSLAAGNGAGIFIQCWAWA